MARIYTIHVEPRQAGYVAECFVQHESAVLVGKGVGQSEEAAAKRAIQQASHKRRVADRAMQSLVEQHFESGQP